MCVLVCLQLINLYDSKGGGAWLADVFGNAANKINKHEVPNKDIATKLQTFVGVNKNVFAIKT